MPTSPPARSLWTTRDAIAALDQRWLPHRVVVEDLRDARAVSTAIRNMHVRGAPLIGATAAFGMALAARAGDDVEEAARVLLATRPTAVDLRHAVERMHRARGAWSEAERIHDEYVERHRLLGEHGAKLIEGRERILTHCNAGWLAAVAHGTATAPLYALHARGAPLHVWVDETRPRHQGALTAWELSQAGIANTLVADNAGGLLMRRGEVDAVIVGADRIARNGDVANKVGTYLKALAARDNGVPFYVAAPSTTLDGTLASGDDVPIEERSADEVLYAWGADEATGEPARVRLAAGGTRAANPAFDITPASLVTGILTERGVFAPDEVAKAHDL